ncbi:hypothetical protein Trco_003472 [Trichoderma cornu-damae]|uniref:Uncharacterized protein n=1 Tax=Trichoderma cornu-damae TaxID=654480 RepID=A0A9P8TW09_9HYPO|nr:hypothetical protein Trco_003472 [Trichoderma cornu-damae]
MHELFMAHNHLKGGQRIQFPDPVVIVVIIVVHHHCNKTTIIITVTSRMPRLVRSETIFLAERLKLRVA